MTAPLDYDGLSLGISPQQLQSAADAIVGTDPTTIGGWVNDVVTSLNKINTTISDLKVGWAGATADEATAFFDKYNAAMNALLGTKEDPKSGVLTLVADGLGNAAANYNEAETGIDQMFGQLISNLTPTYTAPPNITDSITPPTVWVTEWYQGAVSELY